MKLSKELELWHCDRPDEWKMDEFRRNAEKLEAERDALAAQVEKLKPLARRCLWGAINWNDHNFGPLHKYCRESAAEAGVYTIDQANTLLEEAPAQALAEIRAEAVLQFAHWAFDTCPNIDCMFDDKDDYIAKIRKGGAA
jgi:hypothetical protein